MPGISAHFVAAEQPVAATARSPSRAVAVLERDGDIR
jgi:hypothetical protein